jgi:hypothetical protein
MTFIVWQQNFNPGKMEFALMPQTAKKIAA